MQDKRIHTLLKHKLVFYEYLLWYLCCLCIFKFLLEYIHLQNCQTTLHYHHLQINLSNEFLLICTHQDLLHMPHALD